MLPTRAPASASRAPSWPSHGCCWLLHSSWGWAVRRLVQRRSERLTLRAGALSLASCMCNGCNVLQDSHAVVSEPPPVSSSVSRAPAGAAARSRGAACGCGVASLLSRHYHVLRGEVRPCARRGGAAAADRPAASALQPGVLEDAGAHLLFSRLLACSAMCVRDCILQAQQQQQQRAGVFELSESL